MKIAIVTLHRVYNYGSVLQAFATQKVFEKMDQEVTVIDYITPQRTKRRIFAGINPNISQHFAVRFLYKCAKIVSIMLKENTFGKFIKDNLYLSKKYITVEDLEKDPPNADLYVTGSDQTWNSSYNEGVDRGFFLDFLPQDSRRISFVSSFGKTKLEDGEVEITRKYLEKYSNLSVREDSALDILKELGRNDAIQLIDPTLQLEKKEWLTIASKRLIKEKYLVLMLLYNEDNNATEYARKIADEKGLKLVKLSWEFKRPAQVDKLMTHRSPADFLSLFYYADFVVTNSFHGLAFSINLEKQFIIVPRNEYNSRIESLLKLTGLEDRLVCNEDDIKVASCQIDYIPVGEVLYKERKRAEQYLREVLF